MYITKTTEKFIFIVIRIPRYLHVNSRMKPLSKLKWNVETHSTTRNPTLNYLKFFSVATGNRKVARMKGVNRRNYRGQASFACANMATSVFRITTLSTGTGTIVHFRSTQSKRREVSRHLVYGQAISLRGKRARMRNRCLNKCQSTKI